MNEIQIKAAAERLKLETELGAAIEKYESMERQIDFIKNGLLKLQNDPEHYFEVEEKINSMFGK